MANSAYTRRRNKRKSPFKPSFMAIICVAAVVLACVLASRVNSQTDNENRHPYNEKNMPDNLTYVVMPENIPSKMVEYAGFEVNFNPMMHVPNYSAWELTDEKTNGAANRKNVDFAEDSNVKGCPTPADYKRSGFDRGHMVPAADMKWSNESMIDCHYLTNIAPQDNSLNTGAWSVLENNCRKWAKNYGRIIIVAGPVLSDRITRTIGASKVAVPERFFKVILAPDVVPPRAIGFIMPNSYVEGGMQATVVSVDQVEAVTGFDFFSSLPDEIENEIESSSNLSAWQRGL